MIDVVQINIIRTKLIKVMPMYIKRVFKRMQKMQKNTWRFMVMCFCSAYFYLIIAILMLITNEIQGQVVLVRNALEIASMSQAVLIVCGIGSVIIEDTTLNK